MRSKPGSVCSMAETVPAPLIHRDDIASRSDAQAAGDRRLALRQGVEALAGSLHAPVRVAEAQQL
jgi:hypothetical protein